MFCLMVLVKIYGVWEMYVSEFWKVILLLIFEILLVIVNRRVDFLFFMGFVMIVKFFGVVVNFIFCRENFFLWLFWEYERFDIRRDFFLGFFLLMVEVLFDFFCLFESLFDFDVFFIKLLLEILCNLFKSRNFLIFWSDV